MKRFFVIALCLLFAQAAWAQKFSVPAIPNEIEKSEYVKYEKDFIRCMDWLESHSPSAAQRKDVNSFVLWWLSGTPDVHIEVNTDVANFNNGDLLLLYIGGWAKHSINNPDASDVDGSMAGYETVIDYYLKYKDSLGKIKGVEDMIKMKNKGTLRQHVESSMKK
ncbi:MAG: hypothetical protein J6Y35_04110 [Bacteroidales bacterium]|nr:hypothetical protein [Bacteroidales bacterium]